MDHDRSDCRDWIEQCDEHALARLIQRHGAGILGVCRRQLGPGDDADEAFQAVCIILARRCVSVDPARLRTWLHAVALRVCAKARRTAIRRLRHEREAAMQQQHSSPAPAAADWSRIRPGLDEALTSLPVAQREVIIGHYLEGIPQTEIARQLGISPDAAHQRIHHALGKLRAWFGRRGLALDAGVWTAGLAGEQIVVPRDVIAHGVQAALHPAAAGGAATLAAGIPTVAMGKTLMAGMAALLLAIVLGVMAIPRPDAVPPPRVLSAVVPPSAPLPPEPAPAPPPEPVLKLAPGNPSSATVIPRIELSYGGGGPLPPEPLAGWWRDAVAEAGGWWEKRSGVANPAGTPLCRDFRLVAAMTDALEMSQGGCKPQPVISVSIGGASPALQSSVEAAARRWPGHKMTLIGDRLCLTHDVLVADPTPPAPGWRMVLSGYGRQFDKMDFALQGSKVRGVYEWLRTVLVSHMRLEASIAPDGSGRIGLNMPLPVFTMPDPDVVARIPSDGTFMHAVLGVDTGMLLACDWWNPVPAGQAAIARDLTGTWAVVARDPGHALLIMPHSQWLSDRLRDLLADPAWTSGRWGRYLLVANDASLLAAWRSPAKRPGRALVSGIVGTASLRAGRIPEVLTLIANKVLIRHWYSLAPGRYFAPGNDFFSVQWTDAAMRAHWPLPTRLEGATTRTAWLDHVVKERHYDVREAIMVDRPGEAGSAGPATLGRILDEAGPQHMTLSVDGAGCPRLLLEGRILPWLLPGLALRWFADWGEDQEGRIRLRETMAQLVTTPDEALGVMPANGQHIKTACRELLRLAVKLTTMERNSDLIPQPEPVELARHGVPVSAQSVSDDAIARVRGLLPLAAAQDSTLPDWFDRRSMRLPLDLTREEFITLHGGAGPARFGLEVAGMGRVLAMAGDPDGVRLADDALRALAIPDARNLERIRAFRDDAYLAAIVIGNLPPAIRTAWLSESWVPASTLWRQERLSLIRKQAENLLLFPGVEGVLTPRQLRAWTADDLATILLWQRQGERGDLTMSPVLPARAYSTGAGLFLVRAEHRPMARHHLLRLAARIRLLSQDQILPTEAKNLDAVVGPLSIPYGAVRLPLAYERRGERGFRLGVDTSGPCPAGVPEEDWIGWRRSSPATAGACLVLPELTTLDLAIGQSPASLPLRRTAGPSGADRF